MKKRFFSGILSASLSLSAFAQGTVQFQNVNGATGLVELDPLHYGQPSTNSFTVELLYGTVGTPIGSLQSAVIFYVPSPTSGKFFDGATITLSGIPAGTGSSDPTMSVTLAVRGWSGNFANYALAVASGADAGETATFNNPTGGAGTATPANLVGWTSANNLIQPDPEPSTVVLGLVGATALWLYRRRKLGQ